MSCLKASLVPMGHQFVVGSGSPCVHVNPQVFPMRGQSISSTREQNYRCGQQKQKSTEAREGMPRNKRIQRVLGRAGRVLPDLLPIENLVFLCHMLQKFTEKPNSV